MKNRKYVLMGGFAFSENSDMEKLKNLAKQGWILDGVSLPLLSYRFKKGEPQNLDFAVDYQKEVDEEYFQLFESAGWKHELSLSDDIHLFSAPEGTKPIYTDRYSKIDTLNVVGDRLKKPSIFTAILLLAMMIFNIVVRPDGMLHYIITFLIYIALIFTGLPYIAYKYRIRKLKRQSMDKTF